MNSIVYNTTYSLSSLAGAHNLLCYNTANYNSNGKWESGKLYNLVKVAVKKLQASHNMKLYMTI